MLFWSKFKWRVASPRKSETTDPDTLTIAGETVLIAGQTVEVR